MFDHVVFAFTGTSAQVSPLGWRKQYYNNILKKKDANMQLKLIYFYFLEKEKKTLNFPYQTIWFNPLAMMISCTCQILTSNLIAPNIFESFRVNLAI